MTTQPGFLRPTYESIQAVSKGFGLRVFWLRRIYGYRRLNVIGRWNRNVHIVCPWVTIPDRIA